jgi:plastocyanin
LRNEDAGMNHDLALPQLDRASRGLLAAGETGVLELRAPSAAGDYEYVCTMHARMMRGVLAVR